MFPVCVGVDVLKCVWKQVDLVCDVTYGLEFNRSVTDRLAITIPLAKDIHIGEYLCKVERTSESARSCKFSLGISNLFSFEIV